MIRRLLRAWRRLFPLRRTYYAVLYIQNHNGDLRLIKWENRTGRRGRGPKPEVVIPATKNSDGIWREVTEL